MQSHVAMIYNALVPVSMIFMILSLLVMSLTLRTCLLIHLLVSWEFFVDMTITVPLNHNNIVVSAHAHLSVSTHS